LELNLVMEVKENKKSFFKCISVSIEKKRKEKKKTGDDIWLLPE